MKFHRTLLLVTILVAASGCASHSIKQQELPVPVEMAFKLGEEQAVAPEVTAPRRDDSRAPPPLLSVEVVEPLFQEEATTPFAASADGASSGTEGEEQPEVDSVSSQTQELVRDPWEPFNRKMHGLNNLADEFVLRPVAVGYQKITPEPIRFGISNLFSNLGVIGTGVNQVLQGQLKPAAKSFFRFAVNTTIGIVGVFDPASHLGFPKSEDEDFGQTLAAWGWRDSRYLVLPLLGPRTLRDAIGVLGDRPLSPIGQIQDSGTAAGLQVMEIVDVRTQLLPVDKFRREAFDDYLFVRDAWVQRRKRKIELQSQGDLD